MPSYTFGLGKGESEPCSPYRQVNVFGEPLNTPNLNDFNCAPDLIGSTTAFDLSTITKNNEVVVALLKAQNIVGGPTTVIFRWYRDRDDKLIWQGSQSFVTTGWGGFWISSYIGWLDREINENGKYSVKVAVTGADSYLWTIYFNVTGIVSVVPLPPPPPELTAGIVEALNSVSSFFYSIYTTTLGWVWPFFVVADLFYGLSSLFSTLAWGFSDFFTTFNTLLDSIGGFFSWDEIWSFILSYVPNLPDIRDWFYSWVTNVTGVVSSWWAATWPTVQGWISAAVQPFNTMLTAWSNFWNNTWPQLTSSFNGLKSDWGNFWSQTLPSLVSNINLETWWNTRLKDIDTWIDSKFKDRTPFWGGWQDIRTSVLTFFEDPVEFIWERFTDWFLGPEV
jgi:hypothetical protein